MGRIWLAVGIGFAGALLVLLISWFRPTSAGDVDPAERYCLVNLRKIGAALELYSGDHDGKLPPAERWLDSISPVIPPAARHCPKVPPGHGFGYAFYLPLSGKGMSQGGPIERTPMVFDSMNLERNAATDLTTLPVPGRHRGRNMGAFADGHVGPLSP